MTKLPKARALVLVVGVLAALAMRMAACAPGQYELTDDTAHDAKTDLTWQRSVAPGTYTWPDANTYCQGLTLGGGVAGWRLPTIKELQTIIDERAYGPAIDTTAFPATPSEFFWSSSLCAAFSDAAWGVDFYGGHVYIDVVGYYSFRVRCVR